MKGDDEGSSEKGKVTEVEGTAVEEEAPKHQFNHKLSFVFALIASVFFGMADYLIALLSIKQGMKWMYPTYMVTTVVWTIFHIGRWIKMNK